MAKLHLFASEAALEAALDPLIRTRGLVAIELGRELTSIPRLLDEAIATQRDVVELGEGGERLALHLAAGQVGPLGPLPSSLRPALAHAFVALRRAGVVSSSVRHVAPQLPDAARVDAVVLAARLERYEQLLDGRQDRGGLQRVGLQAIVVAPLRALVEVDVVDVHAAPPFDPLTRLVIEALAARGLTVRCGVVEARAGTTRWDTSLGEAVTRALDLLELDGGARVERVVVPLPPGPTPTLTRSATPALEARTVARRVRDVVAAGLAADQIAVATNDETLRDHLRRALRTYDVPVAERPSLHGDQTALHRVVRSIYELAVEGASPGPLATLLASPLFEPLRAAGQTVAPARLAAFVRRALPESPPDAWDEPLLAFASGPAGHAMARHVLAVRSKLLALPERAPLARHLIALAALLDELGVAKRLRRYVGQPLASFDDAPLAHEQASLEMLEQLLVELPAGARRLRLADRSLLRREVAELLLSAWAEPSLRIGGVRGGVVTVCALAAIPESASLVVVAGASEDALRGSASDLLLSDETLTTLGRALGRPLFDAPSDPARRERLRLARALGRAETVWITRSRSDDQGRALLPGELVEHAVAQGVIEEAESDLRIVAIEEARTKPELVARLLVEEHGDLGAREGLDAATRARLRSALELDSVEARVLLERHRERFFAGLEEASTHDGLVLDAQVRTRLVERALPGREARPLSASTLQRYASCPQRFWLDDVLRVSPPDDATDELDERAAGILTHHALEALFSAWRDADLLPLRGRVEEEAHLEPVLTGVIERWRKEHAIGNAVLFEQRRRALARLLAAVWTHEVERPFVAGLVPALFEHRFEKLSVPAPSSDAPPVFVGGTIDRIDRSGARAAVIDYKSGRIDRLRGDLEESAFGETSWQLPLYAAAARAQLGVDEVSMVYYSLREQKTKLAPAPSWLRLDEGPLVDKLWASVQRMRDGHFEVRPRPDACETCRLQAACRIVEKRVEEDEVE